MIGACGLALLSLAGIGRRPIPPDTVDTAAVVTFGAFVDTYLAWDFNRPPSLDRSFTTQASRHSEANVNLAFVEALLRGPRVRGRVAVQFGTSVQANYAGEPRVGVVSGPDVSRFLQEAYAGYQLATGLWLDAGVMLAPFGSESWISRDNWTYTRSLIADNSPYYESGVRATWAATRTIEAQLHVLNGWQNISENNESKAVAARLQWMPRRGLRLVYDDFVGNEAPDTAANRLRVFQEVSVARDVTERLSLAATVDWGSEHGGPRPSTRWGGFALIARAAATRRVGVSGRVEQYRDRAQTIVATGTADGLRAIGGSLNLDFQADPRLLWRVEVRELSNATPVFPRRDARTLSRIDRLLVVSAALTL